jgi:hypothetical protein
VNADRERIAECPRGEKKERNMRFLGEAELEYSRRDVKNTSEENEIRHEYLDSITHAFARRNAKYSKFYVNAQKAWAETSLTRDWSASNERESVLGKDDQPL